MVFDSNKRIYKGLSALALLSLLFQIVFPLSSIAQTGPNQQESMGYSHSSGGEYVDNFTGDFSYNIPLMTIEGVPLNLGYNSNVSMNEDASWVGLGWSLNPGSISRQLRGIPDEFNGEDKIHREFTRKPSVIQGKKNGVDISAGVGIGVVGVGGGISFMKGKYYNNYRGQGKTVDFGLGGGISAGLGITPDNAPSLGAGVGLNFGLGFSFDSQNGIGINPSLGFSVSGSVGILNGGYGGSISTNINTREGQKARTYMSSVSMGVLTVSKTSSRGSIKTFGTQTYMPRLQFSNFGFGYSIRKGGGLYASVAGVSASLNGVKETYGNTTLFIEKDKYVPAYGYHNLELAKDDPEGLMDFNREKERIFSKDMESLPFTNLTYDLYQVNTPGIYSMFRAYRNEVGTLTDAEVYNGSVAFNKVSSKSFGVWYKSVKGSGVSLSGAYSGGQEIVDAYLAYVNKSLDVEGAEKFYFKVVGEKTPWNDQLFQDNGGINPTSLEMAYDQINKKINTTNILFNDANQTTVLPSNNFKTDREIRSTAINYFTNAELELLQQDEIRNYAAYVPNSDGTQSYSIVNDNYRSEHHFGKMEVTSESGATYGYGIPAYNIVDSEVAFNVEPSAGEVKSSNLMVVYDHGGNSDNSMLNEKGRDHFYDKTSTSAYPHTYLLTEIKSSDYVDRTGNGFSADDIGNYVKFNYTRVYGGATPFKWRFPVSQEAPSASGYPEANFNSGYETDNLDDKGFYSYGEKELWYPNSIETKNFICEFYLEDRDDAFPILDENGQLDLSKPSKLLKKIVLYAREDRMKNGVNAIPLKTVEFDYDYSLCRNNPSNRNTLGNQYDYDTSGKLTLKSIRFSSGDSKQGSQSPFVFTYENNNNNPDFNYLNTDRWANYKPSNGIKDNLHFPYADQDPVAADDNIKAWKLKRVVSPTGGGLEVEYEADTYANIQDKEVMRHYDLIGMTDFPNLVNKLYNAPVDNYSSTILSLSAEFRDLNEKKIPNNVLYFRLDEPIVGPRNLANVVLKNEYFTQIVNNQPKVIEEIYHRTKVKINNDDLIGEFIPGFAKIKKSVTKNDDEYKKQKNLVDTYSSSSFNSIDGIGVVGGDDGPYHYGYVIVENVGIKDKIKNGSFVTKGYPVNPIQKNAWNFVRLNMPWHIYAKCEDVNGDPDIEDCDYGLGADWKTIFTGKINKVLNNNDYCKNFDPLLSTIRLMDSRGYKVGGNGRVKTLTYFDSWDQMSGEIEATYVLEYDYTNQDQDSDQTSGVAAYEPINGGDENVFFQPSYFDIENRLKPDERHYQIDPVGESVFPAPTVGYSSVKVKFKDIQNLTRNSTGSSVFRYFTYRDRPIKVHKGDLRTYPLMEQMQTEDELNYSVLGVSQGFSIELNDFHGKPKSVKVVDAYDNDVSETRYKYYDYYEKQKVVNELGEIDEEYLAKEFDVYVDKRFSEQLNLNAMVVTTKEFGAIPIPKINTNTTIISLLNRFYVATFQKVINHNAILKEVNTTYLGQKSDQKILAFDKFTGQALVSSSNNEFNDADYSVTYPAQWRYKELKSKYKNIRFVASGLTIDGSGNLIGLTNVEEFFSRGDRLLVSDNALNESIAYVLEIDELNNTLELIDNAGTPISAASGVNILNLGSGFKNRLSESMASFFTKNNPISGGNLLVNSSDVINSSAVEYVENDARICEDEFLCGGVPNPNFACADNSDNPFLLGIVGNWRPSMVYAFQGERINNDALAQTDIQNDGRINSFIPFYAISGGEWRTIVEAGHPNFINSSNYQNWRRLNEVTKFDRFGRPVETRSQLGIYTSIIYGYNSNFKLIPIAKANNAKISQIGFDGFEDYFYLDNEIICNTTGHFDFREAVVAADIVTNERHTGNYSLKVGALDSKSVTRKVEDCSNGIGKDCNCDSKFGPTPGKYVVGAWVKREYSEQSTSYSDANILVEFTDEGNSPFGSYSFQPSGKIVEGWQRIEGVFDVPGGAEGALCITISLENNGYQQMYFDDVRVHPFVSSMESYVYDSNLLLPTASLNSYNYATFYMYDENLMQVRVRAETERGIQTISESNVGIKK